MNDDLYNSSNSNNPGDIKPASGVSNTGGDITPKDNNPIDNQEASIPDIDKLMKALNMERDAVAKERKKAKEAQDALQALAEKEQQIKRQNETLQAQLYELTNNPRNQKAEVDSAISQVVQGETMKNILKEKDEVIRSKDQKIEELERQRKKFELDSIIDKTYMACGGIPDSDSRNLGLTDRRFLPSKLIHQQMSNMIGHDTDGQIVILDENGQIEYDSHGGRKSIADKMMELKNTEGTSHFFGEDYRSGINTPVASSSAQSRGRGGTFVDRELVRQGKASIDDIASGKKIVGGKPNY
jgi:hypothetical protein